MCLSALLCEKSSRSVSRWTRNTVDQIVIEGDAMYVKAFEQHSIPDTETLPLTYLPNRAVWPSTRPNQSPIESNNALNQSPIVIEAQTNFQSLMKVTNNQLPMMVEPTEAQTNQSLMKVTSNQLPMMIEPTEASTNSLVWAINYKDRLLSMKNRTW